MPQSFRHCEDARERFEFGKNWQDFVKNNLTRERIDKARHDLLSFLGVSDLKGHRFLDIGSGSGLHSLAAFDAGADSILSFDYDPDSVAATTGMRHSRGEPANWQITRGSILDGDFLGGLGRFDIVYSWGVLHHTGDVWTAIDNARQLVAPGGLFYIALYDADNCAVSPEFWLDVKQRYLATGILGKRAMEIWYVWRFMLGKNPLRLGELLRTAREYKKHRGMSFYTDVKDWLGGWPMEFTTVDAVVAKLQADGFGLLNIKTGEANTEYLFRAPGEPAVASRHGLLVDPATPFKREVVTLREPSELEQLRGDEPLYIYGAGKAGTILHDLLQAAGLQPAGFVTTRDRGECCDLAVIPLDEFLAGQDRQRAQILIASSHIMDISFELARHGISRFWNAYPLVLRSL